MRKTLRISPKPVFPPPTELELKLVQDTRINANVVHLYVSGVDHPVMQFKIVNEKLTFTRITFSPDDLAKRNWRIEDINGKGHFVLSEMSEKDGFPIAFGWPSEREAFNRDVSSADLDAQVEQGGIARAGKPRC